MSRLWKFVKVARWFVLAALVAVLFLILRTPDPPRVMVDNDARRRLAAKLAQLSAPDGRVAGPLRLDEGEVNGWIESRMPAAKQQPAPTDGGAPPSLSDASLQELQSNVRDLKVHLEGDHATAYVLFNLHGKDVALTVTGHVSAQDGFLRVKPTGMNLGSMPIPQATFEQAIARVLDDPRNREKLRLPPNVAGLKVENGELVVILR